VTVAVVARELSELLLYTALLLAHIPFAELELFAFEL
jgi:hypothetical protein